MTQPTQDILLGFTLSDNATVTPFVTTFALTPAAAQVGAAWGSYPADDNPDFPYHPRLPHATGFQFDMLALRILDADYATGVLDELGHPLTDEYGAPLT